MMTDLRYSDYFLFTQHSLATFDSCPLKFRKRYLENLKWNSYPDEKVKRSLEKGRTFHLLAQRYFMGIDHGLDESFEEYPELNRWIATLKESFKISPEYRYLPEYKLRMCEGIFKLEANFDLLAAGDGRIAIWDWKTHGNKDRNPGKTSGRFENSLQTMVYMFVLKEQSRLAAGRELECGAISMNYWQPDPPGIVARVEYSDNLHRKFKKTLEQKIRRILEYDYSDFDKSLYIKHCPYCEFNWFCNNERVDFSTVDEDDSVMEDFDWDSVEERF
jgi:CRISPR/Cas system-associated exonuclease Cas4 (RecB family)